MRALDLKKLISFRATRPYLIVVFLALLILSIYRSAGTHGFINFDDDIYVFRNQQVLNGLTREGFRWAFTSFHASNWHPLTWLSHMLDVELFGLSAGWHHRMNVFYHLMNSELLFLVLWRITGRIWQSAFVAALFSVHPLNVESVGWVAERKNVLSTMFWILTMAAYMHYVRKPSVKRYLFVIIFYALGLMCKPMLVTLPFVLLLLDYWPLQRFGQDSISSKMLSKSIREKIPLLALSVASCAVTYLSQARGISVYPIGDFPLYLRISNVFVSYAVYIWKMVWPASLAVIYPHPGTVHAGIPAWKILLSVLLIVGFSILVILKARHSPYLAIGWLWYVGTLVPVIGIVQVGAQAYADRYAYLPLVGIFTMVVWGFPLLVDRWRWKGFAISVAGCAIIMALSIASANQLSYWRNNLTLFSRALMVTENNWIAWHNLGTEYRTLGKPQLAISYYREALRIKPDYAMAWYNLGVTHDDLGQIDQAIAHYEQAVKIWPAYSQAWLNLGVAYTELGRSQEAVKSYREALRSKPDFAEAWYNLGLALFNLGQFEHAAACYREAVRIHPDFVMARTELEKTNGILDRRR